MTLSRIKTSVIKSITWLSLRTKTDIFYLAKGGFWLTSGQLIASFASFILSIVMANLISKEDFGVFKYIMSIYGMLSIFSLTGMGTAVTHATARGFDGSIKKVLKIQFFASLIGSLVGAGAAAYYFHQHQNMMALLVLTVSLMLPADIFSIYNFILSGKKRFDLSTKFMAIGQISSLVIISTIVFFYRNAYALIIGYLSFWIIMRFFFYLYTKKLVPLNDLQEKDTVSNGIHLSFIYMLGIISIQADRLIIFNYIGAAQLAVYTIAQSIPYQIRALNRVLNALVFPKFSIKSTEEVKRIIANKIWYLIGAVTILFISYVATSKYIFKLFFPTYPEAVQYSNLFAIAILFIPASLIQQLLISQMKKKELYINQTVLPLIKLGLFVVLLPRFGLTGAILSNLGFEVANTAYSYYLYKKMA